MKNILLRPLFLIALLSYFLLFWCKKAGHYLPFFSDYAADFLTMPVVLSITLFVIRRSQADRRTYTLTARQVITAVVMYALLFEVLFPQIDASATSDPWDVVAYAAGGWVFWQWMNR